MSFVWNDFTLLKHKLENIIWKAVSCRWVKTVQMSPITVNCASYLKRIVGIWINWKIKPSDLSLSFLCLHKDRNECVETPSVCHHGDCVDIPGGYECVCHTGFTATLNRRMCVGKTSLISILSISLGPVPRRPLDAMFTLMRLVIKTLNQTFSSSFYQSNLPVKVYSKCFYLP